MLENVELRGTKMINYKDSRPRVSDATNPNGSSNITIGTEFDSAMDSQTMEGTIEQSLSEYPILRRLRDNNQIKFSTKPTPRGEKDGFLEFYNGDETGTEKHPRPEEFELGVSGIQLRDPETRSIDILGDWVSHEGVNTDPELKGYYDRFKESMTPRQHEELKDQFKTNQKEYGEKRDFDKWKEISGLPGYFRGYAFDQWENSEEWFTPEQIEDFDKMKEYLKK